jgi:antirestriction protein ArdC
MPSLDYVQVPPPQAYFEPINWHRTALHELGHASGHHSRLNRDLTGSFGSKKYAFEEMIAEINAAFCCAALGIVPTVRHADYIGSWLEVLREDNRAIVRAASQASKAADWLLSSGPRPPAKPAASAPPSVCSTASARAFPVHPPIQKTGVPDFRVSGSAAGVALFRGRGRRFAS